MHRPRPGTGFAGHRPPIYTDLKPGADPVWVQQYPLTLEARQDHPPYPRTPGPEDLETLPVGLEYPPPPRQKTQFS